MGDFINAVKTFAASAGALIGGLLGGWDGFLVALAVFIAVDYLTGVAVAIATKTLSSQIGFKGIAKKVLIFALVIIGNLADVYILKSGNIVRTAVIFFYLSNEGISILENAGRLGLPIPKKLKSVLEQLHSTDGKADEGDNPDEATDDDDGGEE